MALQRTRWRPDTCGCVIEYEWDSTEPAESRTHAARTVAACPAHTGTAPAVFATVLSENQKKNHAVAALLEHAPDLTADEIAFAFDAARVLRLTVPRLAAQRPAARAALAAKGLGDVILE